MKTDDYVGNHSIYGAPPPEELPFETELPEDSPRRKNVPEETPPIEDPDDEDAPIREPSEKEDKANDKTPPVQL